MLRNHPPMPTEVREMRIQYEAGQSLDRVGEQFDYFAKTVRRVRHGTRSAVSVAEDALIRRVWGAHRMLGAEDGSDRVASARCQSAQWLSTNRAAWHLGESVAGLARLMPTGNPEKFSLLEESAFSFHEAESRVRYVW